MASVRLPVFVVPACNIVMLVVEIVMAVVPLLIRVTTVPIGKAIEALVGTVTVCAPLLAE